MSLLNPSKHGPQFNVWNRYKTLVDNKKLYYDHPDADMLPEDVFKDLITRNRIIQRGNNKKASKGNSKNKKVEYVDSPLKALTSVNGRLEGKTPMKMQGYDLAYRFPRKDEDYSLAYAFLKGNDAVQKITRIFNVTKKINRPELFVTPEQPITLQVGREVYVGFNMRHPGLNAYDTALVRGKAFSADEAQTIMQDVCAASNLLRKEGFVHLQINVLNVFVAMDKENKVLGARLGGLQYLTRFDGEVRTFNIPGYSAPDVFAILMRIEGEDNRILGEAADVWALAWLFHELVTGSRPLQARSLKLETINATSFLNYEKIWECYDDKLELEPNDALKIKNYATALAGAFRADQQKRITLKEVANVFGARDTNKILPFYDKEQMEKDYETLNGKNLEEKMFLATGWRVFPKYLNAVGDIVSFCYPEEYGQIVVKAGADAVTAQNIDGMIRQKDKCQKCIIDAWFSECEKWIILDSIYRELDPKLGLTWEDVELFYEERSKECKKIYLGATNQKFAQEMIGRTFQQYSKSIKCEQNVGGISKPLVEYYDHLEEIRKTKITDETGNVMSCIQKHNQKLLNTTRKKLFDDALSAFKQEQHSNQDSAKIIEDALDEQKRMEQANEKLQEKIELVRKNQQVGSKETFGDYDVWNFGGVRFYTKTPIGEGGQGKVYRCIGTNAEGRPEVYILKTMKIEGAELFKIIFESSFLNSNYLNGTLGVFVTDTEHVTVHKAEEMDLDNFMKTRGRALTIAEATSIVLDACVGAYQLHQQGKIHRDIKEENIFVTCTEQNCRKFNAVLGDQGFIAECDVVCDNSGTPEYLSPESLARRVCRPEIDTWALGIVLHNILTATRLFQIAQGHSWSNIAGFQSYKKYIELCLEAEKSVNGQNVSTPLQRIKENPALYDLLDRMLQPLPQKRIKLDEAIKILAEISGKHYELEMKQADFGPFQFAQGILTREQIENAEKDYQTVLSRFKYSEDNKFIDNLSKDQLKHFMHYASGWQASPTALSLVWGELSPASVDMWCQSAKANAHHVLWNKDKPPVGLNNNGIKIFEDQALLFRSKKLDECEIAYANMIKTFREKNKIRMNPEEYELFLNREDPVEPGAFQKVMEGLKICLLKDSKENDYAAYSDIGDNLHEKTELDKGAQDLIDSLRDQNISDSSDDDDDDDDKLGLVGTHDNTNDPPQQVKLIYYEDRLCAQTRLNNEDVMAFVSFCTEENVKHRCSLSMISNPFITRHELFLDITLSGKRKIAALTQIPQHNYDSFINGMKQKPSWDDMMKFALSISHGVKSIHGVDLVHGNINPKVLQINFVEDGGEKLIIQLGGLECLSLNDMSFDSAILSKDRDKNWTDAPEVQTNEGFRYTKASDIWALGATFHYCLTGYNLFGGCTEQERRLNAQNFMGYRDYITRCLSVDPVPAPIKEISANTKFVDLMHAMLQQQPWQRPTISKVIKALSEISVRAADTVEQEIDNLKKIDMVRDDTQVYSMKVGDAGESDEEDGEESEEEESKEGGGDGDLKNIGHILDDETQKLVKNLTVDYSVSNAIRMGWQVSPVILELTDGRMRTTWREIWKRYCNKTFIACYNEFGIDAFQLWGSSSWALRPRKDGPLEKALITQKEKLREKAFIEILLCLKDKYKQKIGSGKEQKDVGENRFAFLSRIGRKKTINTESAHEGDDEDDDERYVSQNEDSRRGTVIKSIGTNNAEDLRTKYNHDSNLQNIQEKSRQKASRRDDLYSDNVKLANSCKDLGSQFLQLQSVNQRCFGQLEQCKKEGETCQEEKIKQGDKIRWYEYDRNTLLEQYMNLQIQLENLQKEMDSKKQQHESLDQNLKHLRNMEKELNLKNETLTTKESKVAQRESQIDAKWQEINKKLDEQQGWKEHARNYETMLIERGGELEQSRLRIVDREKQVQQKEAEQIRRTEELEKNADSINIARAKINEMQDEISQALDQLRVKEQTLTKAQKEFDDKKASMQNLTANISVMQNKLGHLDQQYKTLDSEIKTKQAQLDQKDRQVLSYEDRLALIQKNFDKEKANMAKRNAKLGDDIESNLGTSLPGHRDESLPEPLITAAPTKDNTARNIAIIITSVTVIGIFAVVLKVITI